LKVYTTDAFLLFAILCGAVPLRYNLRTQCNPIEQQFRMIGSDLTPEHLTSPSPATPSHEHSTHTHVHDEESLRKIINRLSRVEGHIRGVKTMVQESRPCPDVLIQLAAIRGALDKVARMILDEHLTECVARAAQEGNIDDEIEALKAALDRFLP
jgi:DNA-binding FrmR family transcriptional regulator